MVKMPWSRNKNTSGARVPAEVEEYYQSTRRERRGVAWLLGLATLLLTLAIAAALFFGGRWLYRTLTNNDSEPQPTSQDANQNGDQAGSSDSGDNNADNQPENSGDNPDGSSQPPNGQDTAPSLPTPQPTPNPAPSNGGTTTPSTGPADEIPRTGPTEE